MAIELITTADGSNSLFNTELNETYHSVHGAIQESMHVFIGAGLNFKIEQSSTATLQLLEVGFGTGLNTLLALKRAQETNTKIFYTTLETFPLAEATWSKLNYTDVLGLAERFNSIHTSPWENVASVCAGFDLLKLKSSLQAINFTPDTYDVVFFDAFAPSKQPEMWQLPVLEKIVKGMKRGGVFVTYCAKGQLKRDLKSLGLRVESLPGPPGKMEMVRAIR